jgi:hypothetical protein
MELEKKAKKLLKKYIKYGMPPIVINRNCFESINPNLYSTKELYNSEFFANYIFQILWNNQDGQPRGFFLSNFIFQSSFIKDLEKINNFKEITYFKIKIWKIKNEIFNKLMSDN